VSPHAIVHRRHENHLCLGGEETGRQEVIGKAMRGTPYEIRRSRGHDDDVGAAGEADVIQGVARTEYLRVHGAARHRFERDWAHELTSRTRHHDVDFGARLSKQTRQPH
jgi:hypothetical protein